MYNNSEASVKTVRHHIFHKNFPPTVEWETFVMSGTPSERREKLMDGAINTTIRCFFLFVVNASLSQIYDFWSLFLILLFHVGENKTKRTNESVGRGNDCETCEGFNQNHVFNVQFPIYTYILMFVFILFSRKAVYILILFIIYSKIEYIV